MILQRIIRTWILICIVVALVVVGCEIVKSNMGTAISIGTTSRMDIADESNLEAIKISQEVHERCMQSSMREQNGLTLGEEMALKLAPIINPEVNPHTLFDIVLETYHIACFRYADVPDMRSRTNNMPWVTPQEPLCSNFKGEGL